MHAGGNPHIQPDPRNIAQVATALGGAAGAGRPGQRGDYAAARSRAILASAGSRRCARWEQQARRCKGVPVVAHHKNMTYLCDWLGMQRGRRRCEPKPGVEPSGGAPAASCNAQLAAAAGEDGRARRVPGSARRREWLAEHAGIPAVEAAVHGRRQRQARRTCSACSTTRVARLLAAGGEVNWSAVDCGILRPALLAGLLVLATHVPLGMQVLSRGIVFIDLAIAQIAGLGVIVAGLMDARAAAAGGAGAAALAALPARCC